MNWQDLLVALALVLVLEGLIPFASPGRYRRLVAMLSDIGDNRLRTCGGVGFLFWVGPPFSGP